MDGGFSWASDPRVRWSDALGITYEQMDHNIDSFDGKILVVGASNGFKWYWAGVERLVSKYENIQFATMDGSHHLHMDADTTQLVQLIQSFMDHPVEPIDTDQQSLSG